MLSRVHGHHERSAWLDQAVWTDAAKWIDYFVAHVPRCTDIVVDLEPYWDGDDRFTWLADNPELVVAMSPLWQAFRRHGVRPWIMPGGHLYHYCAWIPRDLAWVCLSELTFTDHADADLARLRAWAARVRCAFIPGLTCNHIRDGGRALAQRGVRAAWIHFSGPDAADYWNFGLVPWFLQRGAAS